MRQMILLPIRHSSTQMDNNEKRTRIIASNEHLLVLGGPGSGKTHVALLKADAILRAETLLSGQTILFLSFARSTVARLAEKAGSLVSGGVKKQLELNTYHGFAWNVLRSHGYLLQPKSSLKLLPPPEAASHLSTFPKDKRDEEKERLFNDEGVLHFDLFARKAASLLSRSARLCRIIANAYPVVILDEFQDTNKDEWDLIQTLGQHSQLVALADADQRIYEFRGADPKRIGEFISLYAPAQFDFGNENNRSNGTDIAQFGNDLLSGANQSRTYKDVKLSPYGFYQGFKATYCLKAAVCDAVSRSVKRSPQNWSVAVLVPSKRLMLSVSSYLESTFDGLPTLPHEVALDTSGPSLAAVLIASVLEANAINDRSLHTLIEKLCQHILGRGGDKPATTGERSLVEALRAFRTTAKIRGSKRTALIEGSRNLLEQRTHLELTGDPGADWLTVRHLFESSAAEELRDVALDAKYLRLLHKGALLRNQLTALWRSHGTYAGAEDSVRAALLQEHLVSPGRPTQGIYVMTIHKSKGKEFSEVVLYEDAYQGRYVRTQATANEIAQARLTLRVGVTRAECRTTILTPRNERCPLL